MIKKIEILAEKIVDYFDNKPKKKQDIPKKTNNNITEETLEKVYYKIIPYHKNDFDSKVFLKFLNNFSSYSQRINFYLAWNNTYWEIIISFPENLDDKFKNNFYNHFPSSKLEKVDFKEPKLDKFIHSVWDDYVQLSKAWEKNFFDETFFLFKDIPSSSKAVIRYSLVINSTWDTQDEYESLFELIWKWLKLFIYGIYYFFYRVFVWEKPKLQTVSRRQKVETWIKWTAISIWVWWHESIKTFYNYINSKTNFDLYMKDEEIFSSTKLSYFSKMFYVPTSSISWLWYINYKRLSPPSNLPTKDDDITAIWYADWADDKQIVWIKQEDKARHVYVVWKTWVWKSTLLSNMALSDLERGRGLALIDPHGDLVENIMQIVPEERKDDVVIFDVSDTKNIPWFNVFERKDDDNIDLSVSTILSIFKKLYGNSWGPRLEYILRNVLLTLSEYEDANFLHIMRILTDKKFRKKVLTHVQDPVIKDFWEKEFAKRSERFSSEATSPIMNKVGQFVSSSIIRNIFWQQNSTISIKDIMQENKILLVNLSKWLIWEDNSAMIWSFIVSWIQLETMKRANIPMKERKNFTLYIDEFQNFVTDSFSTILSEARKYNLSLVVANQYISQIDTKVQSSIFWNVWNIICFNSWNDDAKVLSNQFKNQVTVNDILSIPKFKAYSKIMIDGTSTDVFWLKTNTIDESKVKDIEFVKNLKQLSNKKYTKPKQDVVEQIQWMIDQSQLSWNEEDIQKEKTKKAPNKQNQTEYKPPIKPKKNITNDNSVWDIFEWKVKLKFNYGLFVDAGWYEWLLHKKNINLPEGISWKDYFSIGDSIRVKMLELKEVDWQKKAVWEYV